MSRGIQISGDQFTWDKAKGTGSTFASDLQWDKFPQSFYIKSHKTGETKLFLANERIESGEEFAGYRYISPGQGLEVTVWND